MRNGLRFLLAVLLFIGGIALYVLFEMYIFDDAPKIWPYGFGWLMCGFFCAVLRPKCPCERCKNPKKQEKKDDE